MGDRSKQAELVEYMRRLPSCVVAFSGGVDSAVVAKAAQVAQGGRTLAVTAVSPSFAEGELAVAIDVARQIGIRHETISTLEIENAAYVANHFDRCFHCKTELYSLLATHLAEWNVETIVNGANVDDLGDHRPGMRAAREHQVISPLADCGATKADVRQMAQDWHLSVAEKLATPCLSSRIAYGESVTPERLRRIDLAEQWLRRNGFHDVRVRLHRGDLARLEVPQDDLVRICSEPVRSDLSRSLQELGFKYITLDLEGRRTGSLNHLIPVEQLERQSPGEPPS